MTTTYAEDANKAVDALREWAKDHELPESPWDLPKDCPIWYMGLSLFQAGWALSKVRGELE